MIFSQNVYKGNFDIHYRHFKLKFGHRNIEHFQIIFLLKIYKMLNFYN